MTSIAKGLRREKTRPSTKTSTTMNASGVYKPPYGKTVIQLSGRGVPGNATTGGTYAGTNPTTGGNYAGTNPGTGGNYAGTNPSTTTPGNAYTAYNPVTYNPGTANYNPPTYTPGNTNADYFNETWTGYGPGGMAACPSGWVEVGYDYDDFGKPHRVCDIYQPGNTNPGTYTAGNYVSTNPPSPVPGNAYTAYNPSTTVPGNAYYNTYYPGNAYYNPTVPGNAYYNPTVPGNTGAPTTVLGVTFPGGPKDSIAPVVSGVYVAVPYTANGTPVSVPSGGYLKFDEL